MQFLSQLETKTEKAVALRRLGFRPCEVARYLYPDYVEAPRRATLRVLNLLRARRLREFDTEGFDTHVKPERNAPARSSPAPTSTPLFTKINAQGGERYLYELKQLAWQLYERYVKLHDPQRLAWTTLERGLEACSPLLEGEKVHVKANYVKLPPKAAASLLASLIVTAITCLHNAQLTRGLEKIMEEVKRLQPQYRCFLRDALATVASVL